MVLAAGEIGGDKLQRNWELFVLVLSAGHGRARPSGGFQALHETLRFWLIPVVLVFYPRILNTLRQFLRLTSQNVNQI